MEVRSGENLQRTLDVSIKTKPQGLVQLSSPLFDATPLAKRIADFAMTRHLPSISMFKSFADSGGLMAYGPDQAVFYQRLASYIDKILRGTRPGDLPIEQPTTFHFVINLNTSKALGLTIPLTLLLRADHVIE